MDVPQDLCEQKEGCVRDTRAIYLSLVLEANDDGYLASAPGIQGGFGEGDTIEEAIFNCVDVVKLIVAYRTERGESLGFNAVDVMPGTQLAVAVPIGVA
jgi:predicted RNase H-like HicB family nuclease